jgi:cation/acetate symporter
VTIPIGFFGCWLGTMLGREDSAEERSYDELLVRSETGIGSEGGPEAPTTRTGRFERTEEPARVR